MKKTVRRKFTDEFKEGAGKLITEQGYKFSEAARNQFFELAGVRADIAAYLRL